MAIDLTDDCWEYIFSFLDPFFRDHLPVTLVCKRFLAITNKSCNHLTFAFNREVPSTAPSVLYSRFPNLTSINVITPHPNIDGFIRQLAASVLRLQALHLSSQPHFPRQAMRLLGNNMRDTLRFLTCDNISSMTGDDIVLIADCFSYLHHLKLLGPIIKQDTNFITEEAIRAISIKLVSLLSFTIQPGIDDNFSHLSFENLFLNCSSLLDFEGIFFKKRTVELVWFGCFKSLTTLKLGYANISDAGLVHLSQTGNLKNLSTLDFYCSEEGTVNGSTMRRFLNSCSSLKYLGLFGFNFSSNTIDMDFVGSISKSIKVLKLNNCVNLPNNILYNLLKSCPELEEVILTNFKAVAIPETSFDLPLHRFLRKLTIGSTTLSEKAIMLICSVCPRLEEMEIIGSSQITTGGVKEIFKAGYGRFDCLTVSKTTYDGRLKNFNLYKWYDDDYRGKEWWYLVKDDDNIETDEESGESWDDIDDGRDESESWDDIDDGWYENRYDEDWDEGWDDID